MEETKKINIPIIILIGILLLGMGIGIGYLLFNSKNNTEPEPEPKPEQNKKIVDIETLKKAHDKIIVNANYDTGALSMYNINETTYNNIGEENILTIVYNIENISKNNTTANDLKNNGINVTENDYTGYFKFSKKELEADAKNIFGPDRTIINKNFKPDHLTDCRYVEKAETYFCEMTDGGFEADVDRKVYFNNEYILSDENLIIYDYFVSCDFLDNYDGDIEKAKCYNNAQEHQNSTVNNYFTSMIQQTKNSIELDSSNYTNAQKYAHTFTKQSDGSYYWVSSKPVK